MKALLTVLALLSTASVAAAAPAVQFLDPRDGTTVTQPRVTVTGTAEPRSQATGGAFDVMLVIDTSGSTRVPASVAVDVTGTGPGPFDTLRGGGPSILDVEVTAAMRFVEAADSASTRIGVITFSESGMMSRPGNAWVDQPLTSEFGAVRAALERIGRTRPNGGTDMVAGMRLAIRELRGLSGAVSAPREASKVVLFMTDGFPTLPFPNPVALDERNVNATLDTARVAAKAGIVMHTFCLGREALSAPVVCREAAKVTGGTYHPVHRPADVVQLLPSTKIGRVELVTVRNATTGQMAQKLDVDASGRFTADVPLAPGANRLMVQVQGAGESGTATVVVHYQPDVKIEIERKPEVEIKVEPGK